MSTQVAAAAAGGVEVASGSCSASGSGGDPPEEDPYKIAKMLADAAKKAKHACDASFPQDPPGLNPVANVPPAAGKEGLPIPNAWEDDPAGSA